MKLTKEKFEHLIEAYYKNDDNINEAERIFPMLCESSIVHYGWEMFTEVIESYFTKEGVEWIEAYLYEDCREYYVNKERRELNDIDDLWNVVEKYRK